MGLMYFGTYIIIYNEQFQSISNDSVSLPTSIYALLIVTIKVHLELFIFDKLYLLDIEEMLFFIFSFPRHRCQNV